LKDSGEGFFIINLFTCFGGRYYNNFIWS